METKIRKIVRQIFNESIFNSVEKNSIGGIDFSGDNGLIAKVNVENNFIDAHGNIKPYKHMEVYRIDAPLNPEKIFGRIEKKGYGTEMLKELIQYCKKNKIPFIGSKSLNDKSFALFNKFERLNILSPKEQGLHKRTILWKIM